jgi:hypothetical protein
MDKLKLTVNRSFWFSWDQVVLLGCNTGTGNSAVSQPQVPQVRVRFRNLGPEAVPQPVTAVSRVFAVLSVHCQAVPAKVKVSKHKYWNKIVTS